MLIFYIAGPMTGRKNYNRDAFFAAERMIRNSAAVGVNEGKPIDVEVINPALLPTRLPEKAYLPICTAMIDAADALFVLRGWEDSLGTKAEIAYARRQGIAVLFEADYMKTSVRAGGETCQKANR